MDNIAEKLNLVIDYIENHLTSDINQDQIAQIACCSYYDVSRIFSLIGGIPISEYVRKRKLTLAGNELKYQKAKVLDVALKYGYDSPISFARAFHSFHGFNPGVANRADTMLKMFPRLVYQISVNEVIDVIRKDKIRIAGKEYEASYFGEQDLASFSELYVKRKYWRLEDAYADLNDRPMLDEVLPYNNYPPIHIEIGQVFVIDYYKVDGTIVRKYFIADGTVWENMLCTREILLDDLQPIRTDIITVNGNEYKYKADYFGEQNMASWSDYAVKREFWRLQGTVDAFKNIEMCNEVLPYNNYPPIKIENGQVFVIDYHTKTGTIDRKYYVADGTVWRDMPCTREFVFTRL